MSKLIEMGEHLPSPVRAAAAEALVAVSKNTGTNEIAYQYHDHEFRYRYTDRLTLRSAKRAIRGEEVGHEGVSIRAFEDVGADGHDGIIDIGAHFGVYSVVLGVLNPSLPVWCFEPNEFNRAALEDNLAANGLSDGRVRPRGELVTGESETVEFFEDPTTSGTVNHTARPAAKHEGHNPTRKESIALSEFLKDRGVHSPWVKIDAEGAEDEILEDLFTAPHIDRLAGFVELHLNRDHISIEGITELVESHGYVLEQVKEATGTPAYLFYQE